MDMLKICGLSVCGCIFVLVLKEQKAAFGTVLTLALSLILFSLSFPYIDGAFKTLRNLYENVGGGNAHFTLLLKMIGISVAGQIGADVCKDAGLASVASTVLLFGRVLSLVLCLPAVETLVSLIDSILPT